MYTNIIDRVHRLLLWKVVILRPGEPEPPFDLLEDLGVAPHRVGVAPQREGLPQRHPE